MSISLSGDVANRLQDGMQIGGGAQIPFVAPTVFFKNGNAQLKALNNALYFGGWMMKDLDMEETVRAYNREKHPVGWTQAEVSPRDGDAFSGYITRHVVIAPIAMRSAWRHKDTGIFYPEGGDYVSGTRHVAHVLVYLAEKIIEGKETYYQPAFPAVLSARGFQVNYLKSAFQAWNKYTAPARKQFAPNVPAWCFYLALGTFGNEFKPVMVGKGTQKSPVTPIVPFLPEKITEDTLNVLFVGEGVAGQMADMIEDSKEWINAWKTQAQDPYHSNGNAGPAEPFEGMPDPDLSDDGGDIPF